MTDRPIQYIAVHLIDPDPNQPRKSFDAEALQRFATTIARNGVESPILVRPDGDRFKLVWGERRWRSAQIAGLEFIPAMIDDRPVDPKRQRIRQLLENTGREKLPFLDLAEAIEQLVADGMTAADVASELGLSEGHVSKIRTACKKLAPELKESVRRGDFSIAAAYELAKLASPEAQRDAAKLGQDELLSGEKLARKVRSATRAGKRKRQKVTLPISPGCSIAAQGPEVTLSGLIEWLTQLASKARLAAENGLNLPAFLASLRKAKPAGGAR